MSSTGSLRLRIALGRTFDWTGKEKKEIPALNIEGNTAGIQWLIGLLQRLLESPPDPDYHTHILHGDHPGILLDPEDLHITLLRNR